MKRSIGPVAAVSGGLSVLAVLSGQIALHVGASQRAVLTAILCGYVGLLVVLLKRRNQQG